MLRRILAIVPIALAALALPARAEGLPDPLREASVLVATSKVTGGWRSSVVLAVPVGGEAHLGLLLNRELPVRLAQIFPDHGPSRAVNAPVQYGGPRQFDSLFALAELATEAPAKDGLRVHGNVYLLIDRAAIDSVIEKTPNAARYYIGVTVWRAHELEDELASGWWQVRAPSLQLLLREDPAHLWERLRQKPTARLEQ